MKSNSLTFDVFTEADNFSVDLVFVVDSSSSVGSNWNTILTFISDVLSRLDVGDYVKVGLISYGSTALNVFYFNT